MSTLTPELELAEIIALPSRIGVAYGDRLWDTGWQPYPFLLDAEREIVSACLDRDHEDWLIMNAPNQLGKTVFAALLIFWYIGMFPDRQVIFISYSEAYSHELGRFVRDMFRLYGEELFGVTVDRENDSQGDWTLAGHPGGGLLSVGIGGLITGRQGHLVWIDDVLRNMQEAVSAPTKEAHWKEWKGTIWGRRQPGCTYVVASTRLADDDLTGRLKKEQDEGGGIRWKRLIYPGICEPPDDYEGPLDEYRDRLGRRPGEPLHTRFSKKTDTIDQNWWTDARKQLMSDAIFDCMVQQNPVNSESGMFPEDRWVLLPRAEWPERFLVVRAWDIASTKGSGDFTCGARFEKSFDGRYFVERPYHKQVGPDEGISAVSSHAEADGHDVPILIEQGKSGSEKQLLEFYAKHLPGYMVEPAKTDGTKEQRAYTYSILQQGGKIVLPADEEDAEWVEAWIREHKGMMGDGRRPRHDDRIDVGAYAVRWLAATDISEYANSEDIGDAEMFELWEQLDEMGL